MRRTTFLAPALLASAVVLSACTSQSAEPAASSASQAASEAAQPAATASAAQAFEAVECETLGLDPMFAEIADCGYVTVPENRTSGSDRTIKLAVTTDQGDRRQPRPAGGARFGRPRWPGHDGESAALDAAPAAAPEPRLRLLHAARHQARRAVPRLPRLQRGRTCWPGRQGPPTRRSARLARPRTRPASRTSRRRASTSPPTRPARTPLTSRTSARRSATTRSSTTAPPTAPSSASSSPRSTPTSSPASPSTVSCP